MGNILLSAGWCRNSNPTSRLRDVDFGTAFRTVFWPLLRGGQGVARGVPKRLEIGTDGPWRCFLSVCNGEAIPATLAYPARMSGRICGPIRDPPRSTRMGLGIKTRLRRTLTGPAPYRDLADQLQRIETTGRIQAAFARAAATKARMIDPADPETWEFAGFSQHGEDGIVDHLCGILAEPNRLFVEIGSADGLECCTAWLALARGYGGLMVEGDPGLAAMAHEVYEGRHRRSWSVYPRQAFATTETLPSLLKMCPCQDPDVFSLDIDGIDYWIASKA